MPLILLGGSQFPGPDTAKMQHFPGEEAGAAPAYSALGEQLKIRRTHVFTNCALKLIFLIVTPTEILLTDALKLSCTLLDLHHVLCVCVCMRAHVRKGAWGLHATLLTQLVSEGAETGHWLAAPCP